MREIMVKLRKSGWSVVVSSDRSPSSLVGLGKRLIWHGGRPPLSCLLMNARSVVNKLFNLHHFLSTVKPDMIFITKTCLSSKIKDAELLSNSPYGIYRVDRCMLEVEARLLYFSKHTQFLRVKPLYFSQSLVLCFETVSFIETYPSRVRFIVIYRSRNSTNTDDESLPDLLSSIVAARKKTIILSDLNLAVEWEIS